ncbi:UNVERIFIED_CONTAM: hypothetical protein Slati_3065300 [Sesamum latifolium]|uniref:Uncharacterized protein n=1 Tax=Sesamum latifolium TaxID=2727402 RepID=A0AAW2UTI8_9LAMI
MTEVSPMSLEMCCARRSCGHSRCPNRIGGSYVEQLSTTPSQVISIDAWSRMGTDAKFYALDQGRERDGRRKDRTRTDPKPKCLHDNSPSLYVPWTVARRRPIVTGTPDQGLIKSYQLNGI